MNCTLYYNCDICQQLCQLCKMLIFFLVSRYLDGHARFYRQTILLGSYLNPGMNTVVP